MQLDTVVSLVEKLASKLPYAGEITGDELATVRAIDELSAMSVWSKADEQLVDFLCRRIDVGKTLHSRYSGLNGKPTGSVLTDPNVYALVGIFISLQILGAGASPNLAFRYKRFNTLFKLLDLDVSSEFLKSALYEKVVSEIWPSLGIHAAGLPSVDDDHSPVRDFQHDVRQPKKILPITVLFYEGPIGRAYLETIAAMGYKPQKIIHLVSSKDLISKKEIGTLLPRKIRLGYAIAKQKTQIHHWSRYLQKKQTSLVGHMMSAIEYSLKFPTQMQKKALNLTPLSKYADEFDGLLIKDLKDPLLLKYMSKERRSAVLFCGGGIVPASLLALSNIRLIHIHPGALPEIRGADCTLWSNLVSDRCSASCFYMAQGIDTGDIISARWLPHLKFSAQAIEGLSQSDSYRAIFSFLDPWVRAYLLREVISGNNEFWNISSSCQLEEAGLTYHFMHPRLRELAMKNIFFA